MAEALAPIRAAPGDRHAALRDALEATRRASAVAGVTAEEVEAELAARKRERAGGA